MAEHTVRVIAIAVCFEALLSMAFTVLVAEAVVATVRHGAPLSGRMSPSRAWARIAEALGPDMPVVTLLLHVVMVSFLVLAAPHVGTTGFTFARLSLLILAAL